MFRHVLHTASIAARRAAATHTSEFAMRLLLHDELLTFACRRDLVGNEALYALYFTLLFLQRFCLLLECVYDISCTVCGVLRTVGGSGTAATAVVVPDEFNHHTEVTDSSSGRQACRGDYTHTLSASDQQKTLHFSRVLAVKQE